MELTFVGTGVSCAIPVIGHSSHACCCQSAMDDPNSPNRRNNVSLLITLPPLSSSVAPQRILIDCGKTFRAAYFRVLAPKRVSYVDALLLTHGHADAMQAVEELCRLHSETQRVWCDAHHPSSEPMPRALSHLPTFLTKATWSEVRDVAPAIVEASHIRCAPHFDGPSSSSSSSSTVCDVFFLPEDQPTQMMIPGLHVVDGFSFYSLPVEHGAGYISLGFVFGSGVAFRSDACTATMLAGKSCVAYISDVSDIPPLSMKFLLDLVKIDVLIFDLLAEKGSSSPPHTCWDDVMPYVRQLCPARVFCVGMFCSLEHNAANQLWIRDLEEEKMRVRDVLGAEAAMSADEQHRLRDFISRVESIELAYDGQELEVPL